MAFCLGGRLAQKILKQSRQAFRNTLW
jgi:hypothetical protein